MKPAQCVETRIDRPKIQGEAKIWHDEPFQSDELEVVND